MANVSTALKNNTRIIVLLLSMVIGGTALLTTAAEAQAAATNTKKMQQREFPDKKMRDQYSKYGVADSVKLVNITKEYRTASENLRRVINISIEGSEGKSTKDVMRAVDTTKDVNVLSDAIDLVINLNGILSEAKSIVAKNPNKKDMQSIIEMEENILQLRKALQERLKIIKPDFH